MIAQTTRGEFQKRLQSHLCSLGQLFSLVVFEQSAVISFSSRLLSFDITTFPQAIRKGSKTQQFDFFHLSV